MKMKSKLYLRIILLINYMMEETMSPAKHATLWFSVRQNVAK